MPKRQKKRRDENPAVARLAPFFWLARRLKDQAVRQRIGR
jgi:hypothetical protein